LVSIRNKKNGDGFARDDDFVIFCDGARLFLSSKVGLTSQKKDEIQLKASKISGKSFTKVDSSKSISLFNQIILPHKPTNSLFHKTNSNCIPREISYFKNLKIVFDSGHGVCQ
jgi:hypothetical protein